MAVPSFFKPSFSEFIEAALGGREGSPEPHPDQQNQLQQSASGALVSPGGVFSSPSGTIPGNPTNAGNSSDFNFAFSGTGHAYTDFGLGLPADMTSVLDGFPGGTGAVASGGMDIGVTTRGMDFMSALAPSQGAPSGGIDNTIVPGLTGGGATVPPTTATSASLDPAVTGGTGGSSPQTHVPQQQPQIGPSLQAQLQAQMLLQMQQLEALQQHTRMQQMQLQQMQGQMQLVRAAGPGRGVGVAGGSHQFSPPFSPPVSPPPPPPVPVPPQALQLQQQPSFPPQQQQQQQPGGMLFGVVAARQAGGVGPATELPVSGGAVAAVGALPSASPPSAPHLQASGSLTLLGHKSGGGSVLGMGQPSNPRPCKSKRLSYTSGYSDYAASPASASPQGGLSPSTSVLVGQLCLGPEAPGTGGVGVVVAAGAAANSRTPSSPPSPLILQQQLQKLQKQQKQLQLYQQKQAMQQELRQSVAPSAAALTGLTGVQAGNPNAILISSAAAKLGGMPPGQPALATAGKGSSTGFLTSQDFYALGPRGADGGGGSNSDGDGYHQQHLHQTVSGSPHYHSQATRDKNREAQRRYRERQRGTLVSLQSRAEQQARVIEGLTREKRMVEQHNKMLLERVWKLESSLSQAQAQVQQLHLLLQQNEPHQVHTGSASGGGGGDAMTDGRDAETVASEGPDGIRGSGTAGRGSKTSGPRQSKTGSPGLGPGAAGGASWGNEGFEDGSGKRNSGRSGGGGGSAAAPFPSSFQLSSWPATLAGAAMADRPGSGGIACDGDMDMFDSEPLPAAADSLNSRGGGGAAAVGGTDSPCGGGAGAGDRRDSARLSSASVGREDSANTRRPIG